MNAADALVTIFSVRGLSGLLGAYNSISVAQTKMARAELDYALAPTLNDKVQSLQRLQGATKSLISANLQAAASFAAMAGGILFSLGKMISSYADLGKEIMNIRDLTGATTLASSQMAMQFRVAGIADTQQIRELVKTAQSAFSTQGQGALARLGIPADPNQSGLALFDQVLDRLRAMPEGIRRTQIATEIFGARAVGAVLPLVRLTKEQVDQANALANAYSGEGLKAIQNYEVQSKLLGLTLQTQLVGPIAQAIIPAVTSFATALGHVFQVIHSIDTFFHGGLSWIAGWAAVALSVVGVVKAIGMMNEAIKVSIALEKTFAVLQGIAGGPLQALAVIIGGAAAIGGITAAINAATNAGGPGDTGDTQRQFSGAVDRFGGFVGRLEDVAKVGNGNGLPGGIGQVDAASILRRQAADVIG